MKKVPGNLTGWVADERIRKVQATGCPKILQPLCFCKLLTHKKKTFANIFKLFVTRSVRVDMTS
jgi:hypothetical protein